MPKLFFFLPLGQYIHVAGNRCWDYLPWTPVCSARCWRGSRMVADRQRSRHPGEDPRASLDPLRGPGPGVRACRTHAHCTQHEGRGPDQVTRKGVHLPPPGARLGPDLAAVGTSGMAWGEPRGRACAPATGRGGTICSDCPRPARLLPGCLGKAALRCCLGPQPWAHAQHTCWTFKCSELWDPLLMSLTCFQFSSSVFSVCLRDLS